MAATYQAPGRSADAPGGLGLGLGLVQVPADEPHARQLGLHRRLRLRGLGRRLRLGAPCDGTIRVLYDGTIRDGMIRFLCDGMIHDPLMTRLQPVEPSR